MATNLKTSTSTERPAFLRLRHENGASIVADFRKLTRDDAAEVDRWLLCANSFGSMTWQEVCLFDWINEEDPSFDAFPAA